MVQEGKCVARPVRVSLEAALNALDEPSQGTFDNETLLRLKTCSALKGALTRLRLAPHATSQDADRIILATLIYIVDCLSQGAAAVHQAEWYWEQIEASRWRSVLLWVQIQCGLRPAYVSLAKVRQDAHTRVAKLGKQHDVLAAKLGNVALAWHSQKYTTCSLAVQVAGFLCGESGDASATKKTASKDAAKALLDALEQQESQLANMLSWSECGPPPFLARIWPLLVAYPLISMAVTHYVSSHWDSITTQIRQAGQTIRGLVVDWVWDPTMRMLDTLRAGRAERRLIISRDSLVADQESLERMVRSFGQDKLHLSGAELNESLARVRHGDLTGVMELYERDIRSPIRSMISGSLIRTVLIQVQKAKVDLEVALNGIDWLLHSQELLIGFVGLAPALGLVYVISRLLLRVLRAVIYGRSSVRAQQSQQAARLEAWDALRRIDALVHSDSHQTKSALHYGRLLLDIDCIRHAFQRLIAASTGNGAIAMHLTDEMHDDLSMLEVAGQDALLSTNENAWKHRRNTVDRLWRSWSWLLAMNRLTH